MPCLVHAVLSSELGREFGFKFYSLSRARGFEYGYELVQFSCESVSVCVCVCVFSRLFLGVLVFFLGYFTVMSVDVLVSVVGLHVTASVRVHVCVLCMIICSRPIALQ